MTTRDDLLRKIEHGREHWRALVAEVGAERMNEPGPMGDWTFKDMAAHITGWRDWAITRIEAGPAGDPEPAWPAHLPGDDEINDWIYEQNRDRPLEAVLANADQSFTRLSAALSALPDEDLETPGRIQGFDGTLAGSDFFGHLREEHESAVRAWLASRE